MTTDGRRHQVLAVRAAFRRYPVVIGLGLLWKHLPLPATEKVLETRRGTRLIVPLVRDAGALHAALEVFAFKAYANDWTLEEQPFVVDVGGNIGAFPLWLAESYPDVRGMCYEPDPDAFPFLKRNLALNGIRAVEPRRAAVSDRSGTSVLFRELPGSGVSSLHADVEERQYRDSVATDVVGFDELIDEIDDEISLMKLDCEGSEYEIVQRSRPDSWRRVRRVVVEYHPVHGRSASELASRFGELGFQIVKRDVLGPAAGILWLSR
jgi:FkbM family methyltransferase